MSGVPLQPISKLRVEGRVLRRSPLPRRIYRFRVRTKRDVPHDSPRASSRVGLRRRQEHGVKRMIGELDLTILGHPRFRLCKETLRV